jgi:ABC-type multidrug transport system fused ATPase/permease subunit
MKIISQISTFVNLKQKIMLIFYLFSQIFVSILEFISLSAVPLLIYYLQDPTSMGNKLNDLLGFTNLSFKSLNLDEFASTLFLSLVCILILKNIIQILLSLFEANINKVLHYHNISRLFNYYLNLNIVEISKKNTSELLRNITSAVPKANGYLITHVNILKEIILIFFIFLALLFNNFLVSFFSITFLCLTSLIYVFFIKKKLYLKGLQTMKSNTNIIQNILNSLGVIKEIKIYKIESFFKNYFIQNLKIKLDNDKFKFFVSKILKNVYEISAVILVSIIILIYFKYKQNYNDILPFLALLAVAIARIIPSFNSIFSNYSTLKYNKPAFDKIYQEIFLLKKNINKDKILSSKKISKFENLEIKNLFFQYKNKIVLKKFSFKICKNETIGIVGKTGSGKSTLLNIIMGLIVPEKGEIFINSELVKSFLSNLGYKIGYVTQDIFLINGSIKDNIALGIPKNKIDNNLIKWAAKISDLDELINNYKEGVNTNVGEQGSKLSGGQRQRIAIARAIYRNPELLVLDEATNQLDVETKFKVIKSIKSNLKDTTLIIVSHDGDMNKYYDKIIELN